VTPSVSRVALAGLAVALIAILVFVLVRAGMLGTNERSGGERLSDIRRRGYLTCGVWPEVAGFAQKDAQGQYSGLEVDMCRALSAAIFGTPDKIRFVESETVDGFLESSDVDVVSRRLTWELQREAALGLLFGPIIFYDGQSFLLPNKLGITSARQLSGASICVLAVSHSEVAFELYFKAHALELKKVPLQSADDFAAAFASGQCQAYTADASMLGSIRSKLPNAGEFSILAEHITKEPLAQLVRKGDDAFFDLVRWTVFASIQAEELGVNSRNIDDMLRSRNLEVKRLLGVIPGNGKALGLDERWAYNIIKTLGNYGEIFERNVGMQSSIKLERGLNRLWTAGGLMYAPPLR
jgi:general L-amino acid transport system substrate-binding protein